MSPFWKKKKKKHVMTIGAPTGVTKVTQYAPVAGALEKIPSANMFRALTGRWVENSGATDSKFKLIESYLDTYQAKTDVWDQGAILGQLYFLSDFWLKEHDPDGEHPDERSYSGVYDTYLTICDQLCKTFACQVNLLPQRLQEYWGRILTPHGHHIDRLDLSKDPGGNTPLPPGTPSVVAQYLTRSVAEQFRLVFLNGKAFQSTWWEPKPLKLVLANSSLVGWTYAPGITDAMMDADYAGFALSMGRELYMAHHKGGFEEENFFHSSYLAGDTVLCTGTILIENGVVKAVRNDSGHYQPTLEHLLNVVLTLEMHGVDPASVLVRAVPHSWRNNDVVQTTELTITGDKLIEARGGGYGLQLRNDSNVDQIQKRGGVI